LPARAERWHPAIVLGMEPHPPDRGPGRIINRLERSRVDRRIGEGRSHLETDLIHTFGPYDLKVDTTNGTPAALAESVLAGWRARSFRRAL